MAGDMDIRGAYSKARGVYLELVTDVGVITGASMNAMLSAGIAYGNFQGHEIGKGLVASAIAVGLGGLAFRGAHLHDQMSSVADTAESIANGAPTVPAHKQDYLLIC